MAFGPEWVGIPPRGVWVQEEPLQGGVGLYCRGPYAERVGFEPTVPFGTLVFETSSFSRSDTSPDFWTFGPAEECIGLLAMRQEGKLIGGEETLNVACMAFLAAWAGGGARPLSMVERTQVSHGSMRSGAGRRPGQTVRRKRLRPGEKAKFFQLAMGVETT